jgi:ribonuclease HI
MTWELNTGFTPQKRPQSLRIKTRVQVQYKYSLTEASEQGVGAEIAIYRSGIHTKSLTYRPNNRCTNNQAEQLAIPKSLEYTESLQTRDKTATIHTDSRTTRDALKNNIHTFLIEKIRK